MNTLRHFAAILLIGMFGWPSQGHAQCTSTLELDTTLAAGESASASMNLSGELSSFTVNLNFTGAGSSWAGDMLISVFAPDGSCVGWGGYSYGVTNGCTDLGSGYADGWVSGWNTSVDGFYTHYADASEWDLSGSGDWVVEVENAFYNSGDVTYDLEFVFEGPCAGDCPNPEACNYVPEEEQINPLDEVCLYPEDLYGIGFDCDGVCLEDADGDGICDAVDTCFGDLDECGECNGSNVSGCNDPEACNFNPEANCDDGSCLFLDACGVCGGSSVAGCNDPEACNYSDLADCDDGSCLFGESGCTNPNACNFNCDAACDDGSCLFGEIGCTDLTASNFNPAASCDDGGCYYAPSPEVYCGYGTVWKASIGRCVPVPNADVDFSGCVGMTDLLELLAAFGTCHEWQCGAPLEYQGHNYATVLIGEQCWFAENLRSELYSNGDSIPSNLTQAEWAETTSGACTFHGQWTCYYTGDSNNNDCIEDGALDLYGRLYNWYAASDARGLCPNGWHVPSAFEWSDLKIELGGSQVAGAKMKTTFGWYEGGNGTNSSGFSALPGGRIFSANNSSAFSMNVETRATWWVIPGSNGLPGQNRFISYNSSSMGTIGAFFTPESGHSIRCLQDAVEIPGCTDSSACNYDAAATMDDGSCAEMDCAGICGGDAELDACGVCNGPGDIYECGCFDIPEGDCDCEGNQLDEFGVCGGSASNEFQCSDPVSYQGYDYATVLIGEQCWFAENLRNELYLNGDSIPANLSDEDWVNTSSGAVAVYGEGISECYGYSPDGDVCDEAWSLNEYGRFYNWYAVDDARGLCPSGWHVPTDGEWTALTDQLGGEVVAGGHMKTTYGWCCGGNGTNSSGFSGLPGGLRNHTGGFFHTGSYFYSWSASPDGFSAWNRFLGSDEDVHRGTDNPKRGLSIRCIKNSEE